jgi:3-phenylpropionate/trans-cinnamate dioxygenase ferredoxin reductase subunit
LVRFESWANANEQALEVAAALVDRPRPQRPAPWFWSDQYDSNIQMFGSVPTGEACADPIILGSSASGAISWVYVADQRLAPVIAINRPRDIQAGKRIMARDITVSRDDLVGAGDLAVFLRAATH